jgi:hypothetical protein
LGHSAKIIRLLPEYRLSLYLYDYNHAAEMPAKDLMETYRATPRSLGCYSILSRFMTRKLNAVALLVGVTAESAKVENFLRQFKISVGGTNLKYADCVKIALQSISAMLGGTREVYLVGYHNHSNANVGHGHSSKSNSAKHALSQNSDEAKDPAESGHEGDSAPAGGAEGEGSPVACLVSHLAFDMDDADVQRLQLPNPLTPSLLVAELVAQGDRKKGGKRQRGAESDLLVRTERVEVELKGGSSSSAWLAQSQGGDDDSLLDADASLAESQEDDDESEAQGSQETKQAGPSASRRARTVPVLTDWVGVEIQVPSSFYWHRKADFQRFFVVVAVRRQSETKKEAPDDEDDRAATAAVVSTSDTNTTTAMLPMLERIAVEVGASLGTLWLRLQRKRARLDLLKHVEEHAAAWNAVSDTEMLVRAAALVEQCELQRSERGCLYFGLLRRGGGLYIDYVAASEQSRMAGESLSRSDKKGLSFEVADQMKVRAATVCDRGTAQLSFFLLSYLFSLILSSCYLIFYKHADHRDRR